MEFEQPKSDYKKLLQKQAEIIKNAQPVNPNFRLPKYKSSKQIKQENYDLRQKNQFLTAFKMHAVMPQDLQV